MQLPGPAKYPKSRSLSQNNGNMVHHFGDFGRFRLLLVNATKRKKLSAMFASACHGLSSAKSDLPPQAPGRTCVA